MADTPKRMPPNAGKGRKPGVPNKTTTVLKEAILQALEESGGVEYLKMVAKSDPRTFCAMLGRVLPMQVTGVDGGAVTIRVMTGVPASPEAG